MWPDSPYLAPERVGQLKDIIRRHNRLSTSRLLVVTAIRRAEQRGHEPRGACCAEAAEPVLKDLYPSIRHDEPALATLLPLFWRATNEMRSFVAIGRSFPIGIQR